MMKRSILLLLAAIFSLPTICAAQSSPSVIGKMSWTFNTPMPLGQTTILNQTCQPMAPICEDIFPLGNICQTPAPICFYIPTVFPAFITTMNASVTDPQNGLTHYSLTGTAGSDPSQTFPLTGAMTMNGSSYLMTININQNTLSCTLSTASLNGACINTASPTTPYQMTFK